ncbi:DUF4142 domain-containing protein [Pontibacter harenae]|uniref:DUF4142 domain-containing protein n=1 Tax=Pontibacter harenae TaxID=2894083 RepID=UPI001E3C777A|nr:DUF4142 domain-containing protein [Pontibacter harenae]MCC9168507.1 DUF4142 domain-containing protein [Pontibacter harenae]
MRNYIASACLVAGLFMFASCNSGSNQQEEGAAAGTEAVVAPDSALTEDNKELFEYAYSASMLQSELGKLAAEKGQSANVQQYGQQMSDLYSTKMQELQGLSQEYSVSVPQSMKDNHSEMLQKLRDTDVNEFDKTYLDEVADAHKDAIGEFDSALNSLEETSTGTSFSIWARNTRKEMQAHMEEAMRLGVVLDTDVEAEVRR